jgi:hypothetical protein
MDNSGDDQAAVLTNPRRARFESLGVVVVRAELARGGSMHIGGHQAQEAARQWLAEKNAERSADARRDRRRQLSGGTFLLNIVRVLGGVGVGLFLGWLLWVLL